MTLVKGSRDPLARLTAYWTSLAGGKLPERALLDPGAILSLLPWVLLSQFERDPFRVRYRLTGTMVDQWNGMNIAGRYLDQLVDEGNYGAVEILGKGYRRCCEDAAPVSGEYDWPGPTGGVHMVRYAMFPLLQNGIVAQCLAIEDYSALPHRYDGGPLIR